MTVSGKQISANLSLMTISRSNSGTSTGYPILEVAVVQVVISRQRQVTPDLRHQQQLQFRACGTLREIVPLEPYRTLVESSQVIAFRRELIRFRNQQDIVAVCQPNKIPQPALFSKVMPQRQFHDGSVVTRGCRRFGWLDRSRSPTTLQSSASLRDLRSSWRSQHENSKSDKQQQPALTRI